MDDTLKNSLNSLLLRVEALEDKNNKLELAVSSSNNRFFNLKKTKEDKVKFLHEQLNEATKIIKVLQDNSIKEDKEIVKRIDDLESTLKTFRLKKNELLKTLSDNGSINLQYDLAFNPRVLPRNPKNNILIIDEKDGKLKYFYNKKWRIINEH